MVAYRGAFTLDGLIGADGFVATECNPRPGAGLGYVGAAAPEFPLDILQYLAVAGDAARLRAPELESFLLEAGDRVRWGGGWTPVGRRFESTHVEKLARDGETFRVAADDEDPDATLTLGPGAMGGFPPRRAQLDRTPVGPSLGPLVAAAFAYADAAHDARYRRAHAGTDCPLGQTGERAHDLAERREVFASVARGARGPEDRAHHSRRERGYPACTAHEARGRRLLARRSVMKPGFHFGSTSGCRESPLRMADAGRPRITGCAGEHLVQQFEIDARLRKYGRGLRDREHLSRVDELVAELHDLSHARAAHVHDERGERLERRSRRVEHGRVATDHEGEGAALGADGPT